VDTHHAYHYGEFFEERVAAFGCVTTSEGCGIPKVIHLVSFGAICLQSGTDFPLWIVWSLALPKSIRQRSRANPNETPSLKIQELRVSLVPITPDSGNQTRHWTASVRHDNLLPLLHSGQELAQARLQFCNTYLGHFVWTSCI
jgi:hypothetical protein